MRSWYETLVEAKRYQEATEAVAVARKRFATVQGDKWELPRGQMGLAAAEALIALGEVEDGLAAIPPAQRRLETAFGRGSEPYFQMWATISRLYAAADQRERARAVLEARVTEARATHGAHQGRVRLAFELAVLDADDGRIASAREWLAASRAAAREGGIPIEDLTDVAALAARLE